MCKINKKSFFIFSAISAVPLSLIFSLFFIPARILGVVSLALTAASAWTMHYVLRAAGLSRKGCMPLIYSIVTFLATLIVVLFDSISYEAAMIIVFAGLVATIINCLTIVFCFNYPEPQSAPDCSKSKEGKG
ncbi:MAG: hypothetical protein IJU01_01985 [Lachnospiraceae bacterium]|nr:hypothetical protein [Lachnospiraceae bacterium]